MTAHVSFPKPTTFRSERLRRAIATLPCMDCGRSGATQAAHANQFKGMAIKASDARVAALCVSCHARLDTGGDMTKTERRAYETEMVLKTYICLMESGLLEVAK